MAGRDPPEIIFHVQTLRNIMPGTSRTLKLVLLSTSQTEQAKMKGNKFMASFMFNFHGFSDIVQGEGQVPPEDSLSCVSCQDMNFIFGLLSLLTAGQNGSFS